MKKKATTLTKLDAGENTYGPSPTVQKTLSTFNGYQFYPDPNYQKLREMLAEYTGVGVDSIGVGNGGDEIIDLLSRLTLKAGDEVIDLPPTFGTYNQSTTLCGGTIINVPRTKTYDVDPEKVIKAITSRTKLIFLCNPNNPTGNVTPESVIKKIISLNIRVVVDEAYYEFSGKTAASLLDKYKNLIIIRSFSKWAGIAGLRVGYVLMNPELLKQYMKIKPLYNVNIAADVAARAALSDTPYYAKMIKTIITERERVYAQLRSNKNITVWESGGNFLYVEMNAENQEKIKSMARQFGVVLKYYQNAARITIGRPEENNRVLAIFNQL